MGILNADEQTAIALRTLYQQYGYRPYRVNSFEEYDLYARNKRFLTSEQILTFSDTDGKLMALKPDVTLSIVKNTRDSDAPLKVSYAEHVYRVPRGGYGFKEIMQAGVEHIGTVDVYAMSEMLMLAARSLETISERYVLDVSDMGIVSGILAGEALDDADRSGLLSMISAKNPHGLHERCAELGVSAQAEALLAALIPLYGPLGDTLGELERLPLPDACGEALASLRAVARMTQALGLTRINLDFSIVNDMGYYNGLIFSGFVDGIATSVLSGGRYDLLMRRMGRRSQAIGFAVYLDQLERFYARREAYDVDALILYDGAADPLAVAQAAQDQTAQGRTVRVQPGDGGALRAREIIDLREGRALS